LLFHIVCDFKRALIQHSFLAKAETNLLKQKPKMKNQLIPATVCTFLTAAAKAQDKFMQSIVAIIAFITSRSSHSGSENSPLRTNFTDFAKFHSMQSLHIQQPIKNYQHQHNFILISLLF
jgi:hypothetical protein